MNEHGIYLEAPDGTVVCELVYDAHLRNQQRWLRPWQPHQDVSPDREKVCPVLCNPNNPSKLCQG